MCVAIAFPFCMMPRCFFLAYFLFVAHSYELPAYNDNMHPQLLYDGENMKFGIGTVKDSHNSAPDLEIPIGDGMQLRVPKSFYHYSEHDVEAESGWEVPNGGKLLSLNSLLKNNRKDISGVYLPLPNMQSIHLHFISQRKFEKGIDTSAQDSTSEGALAAAKRVCLRSSENECERALLQYHRKKVFSLQHRRQPLHQQFLNLGDLTSYTAVRDREGRSMGVVVGVPGYDPLYVGATLDMNKDSNLGFQFSSQE